MVGNPWIWYWPPRLLCWSASTAPTLTTPCRGEGEGGREGDGWREREMQGEGEWEGGRTEEGDGKREEEGREGGKEKIEE